MGDYSPPISHLQSLRTTATTNVNFVPVVHLEDDVYDEVSIGDREIQQIDDNWNSHEYYQQVWHNVDAESGFHAEGDNDGDSSDEMDTFSNDVMLPLANMSSEAAVRDRWRGEAYGNFMEWCTENKKWVEMGVRFSLQNDVMSFVLKQMPSQTYTTWETVKRNIFKYSELETTKYLSCVGHELLMKKPEVLIANVPHDCQPCTICPSPSASHVRKQFSSFEYIQLRPRVQKWLANENTFRLIYNEMQEKFSSRQRPNHVEPFFEAFMDGALVKDIVRHRGGWMKCKYDIFLDVSTDGLNVFNSSSYDCWPIICMLHNLSPQNRFLIRNAVTIAFVRGPDEPKRLDTFLLPLLQEIREMNMENACEGARSYCADGVERCMKVHLIWMNGDGPASQKVGGFFGAKGRKMCRFCEISGHLCPGCRSYYFPSKVRVFQDNVGETKHLYSLDDIPVRKRCDIEETWRKLS